MFFWRENVDQEWGKIEKSFIVSINSKWGTGRLQKDFPGDPMEIFVCREIPRPFSVASVCDPPPPPLDPLLGWVLLCTIKYVKNAIYSRTLQVTVVVWIWEISMFYFHLAELIY